MPAHHPADPTPLDAAADELYSLLPAGFVAARNARAKEARSGGDEELSRQIKALRRPSAAAWLVNLLARSDRFDAFGELSRRLREAQTHLDAQAMKELGQERSRVVAELVEHAAALAASADPEFRDSETVRSQVTSTLIAAVADPAAEAAVTSGRLVSPLAYAGFGEVDLTDAVATPLRVVREKKSAKPEPSPPATDDRAVARARDELDEAEDALEEAERAYDEARSRRHQARLDVKRAQQELEELELRS